MEKSQFLIFLSLLVKTLAANLIINGDFEDPQIDINAFFSYSFITGWIGSFQIVGANLTTSQFATQCVDLSDSQNGELRQDVDITSDGTYVVSMEIIAANSSYSSFQSAIYWDGILLGYATPTSAQCKQLIHFIFTSTPGVFELSIEQIGINDDVGVLIDNVCLEKVQNGSACGISGLPIDETTNNQIIEKIEEQNSLSPILYEGLEKTLSFPTNQMGPIKYVSLFLDDLWMYSYDKRNYNKTLFTVFDTTNKIESLKWTLLNYQQKIKLNKSMVPITDMTVFSNKKHVQVDEVDDVFARGALQFCVFSVAQTIILCFVLRKIFLLLFNYKISIFLRRYYFMMPIIIQILVESNIPFFTYLFLRQASIPFFFNFTDKVFLAFSYFGYFWMLILAFCLYLLGNELYDKKFGYFIYCCYRCFPSMLFLTFKHFIRGFVKGVIHAVLHYDYKLEIMFLCLIEFLVIVGAIWGQKKYKIFLTKSMFCLLLLYHFQFIILNILLFTEESLKNSFEQKYNSLNLLQYAGDYNSAFNSLLGKQPMLILVWKLQTIGICSQVIIIIIEMIVELIPNDFMHPQKDDGWNDEIIGVEVYDEDGKVKTDNDPNQMDWLPKFNLDANNPVTYQNSKKKNQQNQNKNRNKVISKNRPEEKKQQISQKKQQMSQKKQQISQKKQQISQKKPIKTSAKQQQEKNSLKRQDKRPKKQEKKIAMKRQMVQVKIVDKDHNIFGEIIQIPRNPSMPGKNKIFQ